MTEKLTAARADIAEALSRARVPALTCSFQAEDMVVLRLVQEQRPKIPVLFLETGYHFKETYRYRDEMAQRYGLNLVNVVPQQSVVDQEAAFGHLNVLQPDRCCKLRKVEPLFAALTGYDVWFTGLRRVQSPTRANLQVFDRFPLPSGEELWKVSPVAAWDDREIWQAARAMEIPLLPLYEDGYTSIGCEPCTSKPIDSLNARSGRWGGRKLECGIHVVEANTH